MDSFSKRVLGLIEKFNKKFMTRKVLKTTEEVEANTNEENLPSAVVVGELINNLGGISFGYTEDGKPGFREEGADTVTPFSKVSITSIGTFNGQGTFAFSEDIELGLITSASVWRPVMSPTTNFKGSIETAHHCVSTNNLYLGIGILRDIKIGDTIQLRGDGGNLFFADIFKIK